MNDRASPSSTHPSQIIVLGMHRSGTSCITGSLELSGAHAGYNSDLTGVSPENPKGFWERRDIRNFCDTVFHGCDADWWKLSQFSVANIPFEVKDKAITLAQPAIRSLNVHHPWVIKEPRLCVLLPILLELLNHPACVHIVRNPLEVAHSLKVRNGFSLQQGIALWEVYNHMAIQNTHHLKVIRIRYESLIKQSDKTMGRVLERLKSFGITGLQQPDPTDLSQFIDSSLRRQKASSGKELNYLTTNQLELWHALRSDRQLTPASLPPLTEATIHVLQDLEHWKVITNRLLDLENNAERKTARKEIENERTVSGVDPQRFLTPIQENLHLLSRQIADLGSSNIDELKKLSQFLTLTQKPTWTETLSSRFRVICWFIKQGLVSPRKTRHIYNEYRQLVSSGLFSAPYYLAQNKDLPRYEVNPGLHFLLHGGFEDRNPSPDFSTSAYLESNPDVRKAGINPLLHYLKYGRDEGRAIVSVRSQDESTPSPAIPLKTIVDSSELSKISTPLHRINNRPMFPAEQDFGLVSVIIPIHNALEDVKRCLNSILQHTFPPIELVLVNDGSECETSNWLETLDRDHRHIVLVKNDVSNGYTCAVNSGVDRSKGSFLVIINSDTIVPPFWLERLLAPMISNPNVAATGPVSNAASYQSVPTVQSNNGWAVNPLPDGVSPITYDRFVRHLARGLLPNNVQLLNGFCYAVRRKVFNDLNGLNEKEFPSGYGEETDFFIRMARLGKKAQIVPNLYVYHAKSKSFGEKRRSTLSSRGNKILARLHGAKVIADAAKTLATNPVLAALRERCLSYASGIQNYQDRPLSIVYLLPVRPGGGGVHSIIQEAEGLNRLGHHVQVLISEIHKTQYARFYDKQFSSGLFVTIEDDASIINAARSANIIVATHFISVRMLRKLALESGQRLFVYYVQDYEPWIVDRNSEHFDQAFSSYGELEGAVLIAKTRWLCKKIKEEHGLHVHKIAPSIDTRIYDVNPVGNRNKTLQISAMIRPFSPRRGAQQTIEVLSIINQQVGSKLKIVVFGCDDSLLKQLDIPEDLNLENQGVIVREQVAEILKTSDLFIDMSTYQAFGRTAIEAMACGCGSIIPEKGGGSEYDWGGTAALPVPTDNPELASKLVLELLQNDDNLNYLRERGIASASQFSIEKASLSIQEVLLSTMGF